MQKIKWGEDGGYQNKRQEEQMFSRLAFKTAQIKRSLFCPKLPCDLDNGSRSTNPV